MKARGLTGFAVVSLLMASDADAKCGRLHVHVTGAVVGISTQPVAIRVVLDPDQGTLSNSIEVRDGKFSDAVPFDTYRSERGKRGKDDCSRVPEAVTIVVLHDEEVVCRRELEIKGMFRRDKAGDYHTRRSLQILFNSGNGVTSCEVTLSTTESQKGSRLRER
jgi:hypothetical protein